MTGARETTDLTFQPEPYEDEGKDSRSRLFKEIYHWKGYGAEQEGDKGKKKEKKNHLNCPKSKFGLLVVSWIFLHNKQQILIIWQSKSIYVLLLLLDLDVCQWGRGVGDEGMWRRNVVIAYLSLQRATSFSWWRRCVPVKARSASPPSCCRSYLNYPTPSRGPPQTCRTSPPPAPPMSGTQTDYVYK